MLLPDGRPVNSCFRFPSLIHPYLNVRALRGIVGDSFSLGYPPLSPLLKTGGPVDWLSGACLVLRRKALGQVGLMDEHFFMYFEDTDLCRRLGRAGLSVWYWPQVGVVHHVGGSSRSDRGRLRLELRRSCLHYFRTHHSRPDFWAVRGVMLGGAALRSPAGAWKARAA